MASLAERSGMNNVQKFMKKDEGLDRVAALNFLLQRGVGVEQQQQGDGWTPEMMEVLALARSGNEAEQRGTTTTKKQLDDAWTAVEQQAVTNQERMKLIKDTLPQKLAAAAEATNYWDHDFFKNFFHLHSAIDAEKLDEKKGLLKVSLKEPGTVGKKGEYAPLRKSLAGVIRQRDSVSKTFTLLLNGLEAIQKKSEPLEQRMRESMFDVPLDMPLRYISDYITRVLFKAQSGHQAESEFYENIYPQLKKMRKEYEALSEESNPKNVQSKLDHELELRTELQPLCIKVIDDTMSAEKALEDTLMPALAQMEVKHLHDVEIIRNACKGITSSAMAVVDEVRSIRKQGEEAMLYEEQRHKAAMKEVEYKLKSSQEKQEKLRRQIRELNKQLHKEQVHHEECFSEATTRLESWYQLDAAHRQFMTACDAREQLLSTASERCQYLAELVDQSQALGEEAIKECKLHCSRTLSEEAFRKLRASKAAVENVTELYRCVGDLSCSKQYRLKNVELKMKDSWQLSYLLEHEKKKLMTSVASIDEERAKVDAAWTQTGVYLAEFKIPIPSLSKMDKDDSIVAMRHHFVELEIANSALSPTKTQLASQNAASFVASHSPRSENAPREPLILPPVPPPRRQTVSAEAEQPPNASAGVATAATPPIAPPIRGVLRNQISVD